MDSDQEKNKDMEIDEGEIVQVVNDDSSDKKPTFRYRRLRDHVGQKSSFKKTLTFFKTWSLLLVSVLLLITILLMVTDHITVNIYKYIHRYLFL